MPPSVQYAANSTAVNSLPLSVRNTKLAATLLRSGLMTLDGIRSSCLGVEEDRPHVAGDVVEEKEVAPASRSSRCEVM